MSYSIRATVVRIGATTNVTDRMTKRTLVVETRDNPKYPQVHEFAATGDRCSALDDFGPGDEVEIEFNLRGREWSKPGGDVRVFNTLSIWKVTALNRAARAKAQEYAPASDDDSLPF